MVKRKRYTKKERHDLYTIAVERYIIELEEEKKNPYDHHDLEYYLCNFLVNVIDYFNKLRSIRLIGMNRWDEVVDKLPEFKKQEPKYRDTSESTWWDKDERVKRLEALEQCKRLSQ